LGTEITYGETIRTPETKTRRAYESWSRLQSNTKPRTSVVGVGSQGVKRTNLGGIVVGIDNIRKIAMLGVEGLNVGIKVMNGGGLFGLLSLIDEVNAVKSIKKEELMMEIKDLSKEERLQLLEEIKQKLQLDKKEIEAKIEEGMDLLNEAIEIGYSAMGVIHSGVELVKKAEQIIKE